MARVRQAPLALVGPAIRAIRDLDLAMEGLRAVFAQRYRVTVNDTIAMSLLSQRASPVTPTELAQMLGVSTGTLTTVLDRLQRAGFLVRRPNEEDRRSVFVALTPEGLSALETFCVHLRSAVRNSVPQENLEHFTECVGRLTLALRSASDELH